MSMTSSVLEIFLRRVVEEWLPTFCKDRGYCVSNFRSVSVTICEADARDCMLAIDKKVVVDHKGGRYRAARSSAHEVFFWDGTRKISPRSTWLWFETIIIFAGVGRLHQKFRWPCSLLATQPKGWAFDIAAYLTEFEPTPYILAEVKKSIAELDRLCQDLESLSAGADSNSVKANSWKKWCALIEMKPTVLWLLGPGEVQYLFSPEYTTDGALLHKTNSSVLDFPVK